MRLKVIFGNQWSLVRKVLTADIELALDNYWERVRQEEKEEGVMITPAAEVSLEQVTSQTLVYLE